MGRKANPTVIGAFVVGAIALIVIALLLLGSGRLFKKTIPFIIFFPGSVNGLNVGAPVKLKGVPIGQVTKIRLSVEEASSGEYRIPVFIEIDPETLTQYGSRVKPMDLRDRGVRETLFKSGLRAQLQSESFVTGVLYVALDVFPPDSPLNLYLPDDSDYMEIPSLPTPLEQAESAFRQILDKLDQIDFKAILDNLQDTVSGINRLVNSPKIDGVLTQLDSALASVDKAAAGIRELSHSANKTVGSLDTRLNEAVNDLSKALTQANLALEEATHTFHSVSNLVEPGSRLTDQMGRTLEDLGEASRSVRRLADSLERNPTTLIYGRGEED